MNRDLGLEIGIVQAVLSYLNQDTGYGILTISELFSVYNHIRIRWNYWSGPWCKICYPSYCLINQSKFKWDYFYFLIALITWFHYLATLLILTTLKNCFLFFFNIVTNTIFELKKKGMKPYENKIKHSQMPQRYIVFIGIWPIKNDRKVKHVIQFLCPTYGNIEIGMLTPCEAFQFSL